MRNAVVTFPEAQDPAARLAVELGIPCLDIELRRFPDGESLVCVPSPAPKIAIVYRSLNDANGKLVELVLAASALRANGAERVILVAPYLAYMRQDMAFRRGEAISQQVIGALLADHFDALLTLDPHLHRIARLDEAVPGIPAVSLSAAPLLATAIDAEEAPLLVGPDSESRPWVEAIARPLGLDVVLGEKHRKGDREVVMTLPGIERVKGRRAILVDDVISSGITMITAADKLYEAGAVAVEALATHCLSHPADLRLMEESGIAPVRSTDTVENPTACLHTAGLIADALLEQGWT